MSFLIDQNEPEELDYWMGQSYEIKRGAFNKTSGNSVAYPDITILSKRIIGINRKQASEWMAGFSDWKSQILLELNGPVDYLVQVIEGAITNDPKDGLWGWNFSAPTITPTIDRTTHQPTGGGIGETWVYKSNHEFKNIYGELIRIADSGIPTFFTGNTFGTALFAVELHSIADREDWEPRLLTQLVKEKFQINEVESIRRNLILFLMGVPGVGQAIATALVDYFGNFDDLYTWVSSGQRISQIPVKGVGIVGRNRTIGPAVEKRIRSFWGLGEI